jgi:molybdopterin/thiamine biosynthesis adenylyltransferase
VALHNINRQILLAGGVGKKRSKVDVLGEELTALDPAARIRAITEFVTEPGDLAGLHDSDALLCVPDNDDARLVCDDARRQADVLLATAGSSAVGGQSIVRRPGQGCLRCLGLNGDAAGGADEGQSCQLVESDAVVSSNMVAAGLAISELREALAGREAVNLRFAGDSTRGNRLVRMIAGTSCPHVIQKRALAS